MKDIALVAFLEAAVVDCRCAPLRDSSMNDECNRVRANDAVEANHFWPCIGPEMLFSLMVANRQSRGRPIMLMNALIA
jgi:hypothetical protein